MDEALLKLVYYILYGLFLAIKFLVLLAIRGVRRLIRWFRDAGSAPARSQPAPTTLARGPAAGSVAPAGNGLASVKYERALATLVADATEEAERCLTEEQNERFADTLSRYVAGRARAAIDRLRAQPSTDALRDAERLVGELSFVLEVTLDLSRQRRDQERLLLLGDADALAEACYRPLLEFSRGSGIRVRSSRAATFLGDKDLAIFTGFIPTGLAPIILPAAWSTEIGWWPALGHEIGHDFHASVVGFDAELRQCLGLTKFGGLPEPRAGLVKSDLDAAYSAWLPEIFADTFGTLMLGAAYVMTMMWAFADAKEPMNVAVVKPIASAQTGAWIAYEEHPPAHLRVVLACRLLAEIGFPREADQLEDEWRRRHGAPDSLLVPTRAKTWWRVDEGPYIAYGEALSSTVYLGRFSSLAGVALRSIPGLDLGPREHQAAIDARDSYLAGREASTRDPRCLIAGAVLAWKERPALSARVLRAARATIPAVGVSRRQLRLRAARDVGAAGALDPSSVDLAMWREAFLLGEAFAPPRGTKLLRRL